MQPKHHHQGNKFDPATGSSDNAETYPGHADPGLDATEQMGHTAGQPDTWPQRPDVSVPKAKVAAGGPNLLGRIPD